MPGRLREESWWSENRDLYNLLLKFSKSEASDPRDKVYALLGISSDARNTDSLRTDYRKSLQEVIHDTSLFLFGPSDVSYKTMSKLLENLTSQNAAPFLNIAKTSGVSEVDHFLTRRGLDNAQSGRYGNALQVALARGHDAVVSLLLDKSADVNAQGGLHGNALQAASFKDHDAVVRLLLDKDADVNAQGGLYGDALHAASFKGHDAVVRLLLDKRADVNAQSGDCGNALQAALFGGHDAVVRLLTSNGASM